MLDGLASIPGWYTGFVLLIAWVCAGLVLYWLQQNRRKKKEAERESDTLAWKSEGRETVEEWERKFRVGEKRK